jgi:hypothetical protein
MVISFFLRLHHLRETGRCPPGLVINITSAQDKARRTLYAAAFQDTKPSDIDLAQMVHTLCDSLLRARISSLEKIFGPVEFTFCFYMQRPDGRYRTANNLTQFFASIQWCLRNILGHIVRLQDSGQSSYTPYYHVEAPSPTTDFTSSGLSILSNSQDNYPEFICPTGDPPEEAPNDPSSTEWVEKEDQLEAGLDSDDPLERLYGSEDEDYPIDQGPGDFVVRETTALYPPSAAQGDAGAAPSDHGGQGLEGDHVIPQDSSGRLQYVDLLGNSCFR